MSELQAQRNQGNVQAFLNSIPDEKKRQDSFTILELMKQVTGKEPEMWGGKASSVLATITTSTKAGRRWLVPGWVLPTQTKPDALHHGQF